MNKAHKHSGGAPSDSSLAVHCVSRVWVWQHCSAFPCTVREKTAFCVVFPSKQSLNAMHRAVFPHGPVTHTVSSWHTQPAHFLKKNIRPPMQIQPMASFFNYHVPVSHCKPLRNLILFWHCCLYTSILQLVDMRQLGFRYALAQVRGKFMAKYVLISFLAEILELLLACTCLYKQMVCIMFLPHL